MKILLKFALYLIASLFSFYIFSSCEDIKKGDKTLVAENRESEDNVARPSQRISEEFKSYWYAGEAELTSYNLKQARYGEIREGKAVLVYVTEPFLIDKQVKADNNGDNATSVLKLNASKKFLTGIYPYSIMSSTFYPVSNDQHALKISNSVQEWCGHVYAQLNNRENFQIMSHSYFESEGDQDLDLPKTWLENEFWTMIRINPETLPIGEHEVIPSFEYIRLGHIPFKASKAILSKANKGSTATYSIEYPQLNRSLAIEYNSTFPYEILGWKETYKSGFGTDAKELTSSAIKIKSLKAPYWTQNKNKDVILRDSLGL